MEWNKVGELLAILERLQGYPALKKIQAAATEALKKMEEECEYEFPQAQPNQPFPPERPNPYISSPGPAGTTNPAGEVIEDKPPEDGPLPGEPGYVPPPEPVSPIEGEPIERRV